MHTTTPWLTDVVSIRECLRAQADARPDAPACTHLIRGEDEGQTLTFGELDRRARALATWFQAHDARGARALLIFDGGLEPSIAFFGCLYAGVIALPLPAPDPGRARRYLPRISAVVRDCGARYVVTTTSLLRQIETALQGQPDLRDLTWITLDTLDLAQADRWRELPVAPDDLAYLQYTSGSTASPKGVMVTQRNLVNICRYNGQMLRIRPDGVAVCWMPYFHDYGLIEGLLLPLTAGMRVYVFAPIEFAQKPLRWLAAIHKYRATHSSGPNFAFALCARKITAAQRAALDLDLRSWEVASCAAEPISSRAVDSFLAAFRDCGFRADAFCPTWGLAEATLLVTGRQKARYFHLEARELEQHRVRLQPLSSDSITRTFVGCGVVTDNDLGISVRIVDPETHEPCPPGAIGEIWVKGGLLARGYWQRPEETAAIFQARIAGSNEGPFLRSGDLGFLAMDELVFTGRRKDLIIVEGRNHYPQDLEKTAEASHRAVRPGCTAAFSVETDADPRVVLIAELQSIYRTSSPDGPDDTRELVRPLDVIKAIRREVSEEHGVALADVVLVRQGGVHKTSSGKIQRSACRASYLSGVLDLAA